MRDIWIRLQRIEYIEKERRGRKERVDAKRYSCICSSMIELIYYWFGGFGPTTKQSMYGCAYIRCLLFVSCSLHNG